MSDLSSKVLVTVLLRDSWLAETTISVGAIVHVMGSFDKHGVCIIDNKRNYIVVNPDFLVSATTVADTASCLRKAVLQERVKATSEISKPMVYGNVLHALLQSALEENDFSTERLRLHADRILTDNIANLYLLREDMPAAVAHVESKVALLQDWARLFVSSKPNVRSQLSLYILVKPC
jgi:DNA replication ATP-dependent helicase Dna2